MSLRSQLSTFVQSRRLLRALEGIERHLQQQTALLARLVDHLAPLPPPLSEGELRQTGPSFSRDAEQGRMLEYAEQVYRDTGREPTAEEIVIWLEGKEV